jgi:methyl-accepting chemotaxis protein
VINANSIFLDLFGYKLEEIIGKHHSIFCLDGVKQTEEYQQFWEKLRAGVFEHGEFLRIDSHRKHIYIQASYNPVFNENNELISIIKITSDVTRNKEMSLEHEGKIAAINKNQAVIEFDLNRHVIAAKDLFLETMGYRIQEVQLRF